MDVVDCHKVLGIMLNTSLKWADHVDIIVKRGAKPLHIIRTLKKSGMPPDDLLTIYVALIRSVLEYCRAIWHTSLPSYLNEQIERLQKRVLRIIFPNLSYREALYASDCVKLDDRRDCLCFNLFSKIMSKTNNKLNSLIPNTRLS